MVTKIHWNSTDTATESLVEPLIEDIGIDEDAPDNRVKDAARKFALSLFNTWPEGEPFLNMGELSCVVGDFSSGYEQCLIDLGLREPDNVRTA
jgi:hypothetical protein